MLPLLPTLLLLLSSTASLQAFLVPSSPLSSRAAAAVRSSAVPASSSPLVYSAARQETKLWADVAEKASDEAEVTERVITVSDSAITHLKDLREKQGVDHLYLRMGVRSGGCSGMSYVLDIMKKEEITEEDHLESYGDHKFSCVVDPKSILYLFGLKLDYKDALIGGGFQFYNPNSNEECGCGKSFGI